MKAQKERYRIQADFCKAMAHPVRLEVIDLLKTGDMTVQDLVEAVGVAQANLSQHLAVLRGRGVVQSVRKGNNTIYTLVNHKIVDACALIREILTERVGQQQSVITSPD